VSEQPPSVYSDWLDSRRSQWRAISDAAKGVYRDRSLTEAREVMDGYRTLARDLALARQESPGSRVHQTLEVLYAQTHKQLNNQRKNPLQELWTWLAETLPTSVRQFKGELWFTSVLFVLTTLAGYICVSYWTDTASMFMSEQMQRMVQNGELWTDDLLNVTPSSVLSYSLMTNNITVALTAFALGLVYGLGTLYIISLNGVMLGAVFAYTAQYQMALPLFRFVIAHGLVELSSICVAGAAGMAIGRALARPGPYGRAASLSEVAMPAAALAGSCILFLIVCGFIEGYVSPNDNFDLASRCLIGVAWFAVFIAILHGGLTHKLGQLVQQIYFKVKAGYANR